MKKIYLVKNNHKNENNTDCEKQNYKNTVPEQEKLIEISGSKFYQLVSDIEGERRYFIRIADDFDFESAEILIEVPQAEYLEWKKENNRHLYLRKLKSCYTEVPFDDALLFLYLESPDGPERILEKSEDLIRLQNAFDSLSEEEKELIWLLYLCKEPLTETQAASVLHISQQAVNKRKQKILERMKTFWL